MYFTDDPVRDAERRESEWEEELSRYPRCKSCRQPILTDKLWVIDGELYCPDCAESDFTEWTENHMR